MKLLKRISAILVLLVLLGMCVPAAAEELTTADTETTQTNSSIIEIYDYNDLLKIKDDPAGTYKLMADIDLGDVMWEPLDFQGTFDGNGYAILNTTITQITSRTRKTYDGNRVEYDTYFSGFFGILEDASVSNLKLLGTKININTDETCFVGGVAGFMERSRISDVELEGEATLYTEGESFGVGGIAGFGNGQIENCVSDMTLVCVDMDAENKDEQFMGGAYAAGYIDLNRNDITIHGYDSDHGYVHNGGLAGMYVLYPVDDGYVGYINNNKVTGGISFFEDNEDRRAYCEPFIGEVMNWTFADNGNEENFETDEHFEYDFTLLPHDCLDPQYQDIITPGTHTDYGYTTHECTICGAYSYRSDYTAPVHEVEDWTVTTEPTEEEEGIRQGACKECGTIVFEKLPKVSADAPAEAAEQETTADAESSEKGSAGKVILIIVVIFAVIVAAWLLYSYLKRRNRRKAAEARRAAQRRAARQRAERQREKQDSQRSKPNRTGPKNRNASGQSRQRPKKKAASGQSGQNKKGSAGSGRSGQNLQRGKAQNKNGHSTQRRTAPKNSRQTAHGKGSRR